MTMFNVKMPPVMFYLVKPEDLAAPLVEPLAPDLALPRACVIGAGSAGIAAAKALYCARVPFDCFEMGSVIGGNWVFNNPNAQSACYTNLEINTSCPRMAYSDFPMPEHYPGYARHWEVAEYFEAYVDHFGFRHTITFETKVEHVSRREDGVFEVEISGTGAAGGREVREYDAVLAANGHHWDPRWPEPAYPGAFDGEQIHAHDYRDPSRLEGKHVVVVGAGNSAMDIAVDASHAALSSTISVRRGQWVLRKHLKGKPVDQRGLPAWAPWELKRRGVAWLAKQSGDLTRHGYPQPDHRPGESHTVQSDRFLERLAEGAITARPGIDRLDGERVVFADGSEARADLIVWATGYRVSFPFLDPQVVSAPGNDLPLWKRTVHPDLPGLFFIGLLQPLGAIMPLAEAQGVWVAELLTGGYLPPSRETMRTGIRNEQEWIAKRFYRSPRHTLEVDFDAYLLDLRRERRRGARRARRAGVRSFEARAQTARQAAAA